MSIMLDDRQMEDNLKEILHKKDLEISRLKGCISDLIETLYHLNYEGLFRCYKCDYVSTSNDDNTFINCEDCGESMCNECMIKSVNKVLCDNCHNDNIV